MDHVTKLAQACDTGPTIGVGAPLLEGAKLFTYERAGRVDQAPALTLARPREPHLARAVTAMEANLPWIIVRNSKKDYGTSKMVEADARYTYVVEKFWIVSGRFI